MAGCLTLSLLFGSGWYASAQDLQVVESSQCLAFVDYDLIVTVELFRSRSGTTPIVNLIALSKGAWELQPDDFELIDQSGEVRKPANFVFETSDPEQPYRNPYLMLRGPDSAGFDLEGSFNDVEALSRVTLDGGEDFLQLVPLDCDDFEKLLERIGNLELGSGNQVVEFQTLNIPLLGERRPK
ncbi:MAG: hypothetical protein Kow00109_05250 [Acidobacteriota bacterium]